jgi:hypothetical protein
MVLRIMDKSGTPVGKEVTSVTRGGKWNKEYAIPMGEEAKSSSQCGRA